MKGILHMFLEKARRMRRFLSAHRVAAVAVLSLSGIALALPQTTEATIFGWMAGAVGSVVGDVAGSAIGWAAFTLGYIIAMLVGALIGVAAYGINVVLQLNTHVVDAIAVQQGFRVTLSLANLGFVLAIIVIAIATIVRYESYGMKKVLWKLIVAALLVNFSLVIAGSIINFSDQLSGSFITAFPGQQTGGTMLDDAGAKVAGIHNFASGLAGAFNPQRSWTFAALGKADSGAQAASAGGQGLGKLFVPFIQLIFTAVTSIFILFALLSLIVLLMIRYIYLGILLILMPLAWLLWIFPLTEKNWSKWWGKFIKWTFFAPITLFFLWLVMLTSSAMSKSGGDDPIGGLSGLGYVPAGGEGILAEIGALFGGAINQILGSFLQATILVALTIAGFFAANALALETSKAAQKVMHAANSYVGRRMGHYGGRAMNRLGAQRLATAAQRQGLSGLRNFSSNIGGNSHPILQKILKPVNWGVNTLVRGTGYAASIVPGGNYLTRAMGRGAQAGLTATGAGIVDEEAKHVKKETKGYTGAQKGSILAGMNPDAQKALLEDMLKKKELKHALWQEKLWAPDTKEEWERVGKGEVYDKLNEAFPGGHERTTVERAAKVYEEAQKTARANAEKTVAATFTKEELDKTPAKDKEALIAQETDEEMRKMQNNPESPLNKGVEMLAKAAGDATEVPPMEKLLHIAEEQLRVTKKNAKTVIGSFFGEKPVPGYTMAETKVMSRVYVTTVANANPTMVPNLIANMNFAETTQFGAEYGGYLTSEIDRLKKSNANPERLKKFQKSLKDLERIIARQGFSEGPQEKEEGEEKEEGGDDHGEESIHVSPAIDTSGGERPHS